MAKISSIIPQQNAQKVRDRIGLILADELSNQATLDPTNTALDGIAVGIGRSAGINPEIIPYVNVLVDRMSYDNENQGQSDNTVTFAIDVYQKAKYDNAKGGDENCETQIMNIMGMIRFILNNPQYKRLDFDAGFIQRRQVKEIQLADPAAKNSVVTQKARMLYEVKIVETVELLSAVTVEEWQTQAYINMTTKGWLWKNFSETDNLIAFDASNLVSFEGDNLQSFTA